MESKYRPDVDGLRAVAILPVIFFHAGLGCGGGFVGVDVFFVISGFLITSLILKEIANCTFSLANFWERRIRRIFPALVVVVFASFGAAWIYYLPEDLSRFGQSVVAQTTLLSNVYFWLKLGYFDPAADTKPLLHTWSLAVEEQFYVLFPLLLLLLARRKWWSHGRAIFCLGMASFALSVAGSYAWPEANFYLLPSRAWELLIGAWLAAVPIPQSIPAWLNETLAVVGTSLILFSVFCYSSATRFPGLAALAPGAGAVLIIFSGGAKPTRISRVLAWRPVVFIGLVSYSLYLWHWPLLVFAKYGRPEIPSRTVRLALLLAAFVLAAVSWRWIEMPFRQRRLCPRRWQIFTLAGCGILTLLSLGASVYGLHGVPSRLPVQARAIISGKLTYGINVSLEQAVQGKFPTLGARDPYQPLTLMLWGDSHAMGVAPALDTLCRKHSVRGAVATHYITPPMLGYITPAHSRGENADAFARAVLDYVAQNHIKIVFLAAKWSIYGTPASLDACLTKTVQALRSAGASAVILKDVPGAPFDVPSVAVSTFMRDGNLERLMTHGSKYDERNKDDEPVFQHLAELGATVLDAPKYFLNSHGFYDVVRDGRILYVDDQHLTLDGSRFLEPMLEPWVK